MKDVMLLMSLKRMVGTKILLIIFLKFGFQSLIFNQ